MPEVIRQELPPVGAHSSGPRYRIGPEERVLKPYKLKKAVILGMGFSIVDYIQRSYDQAYIGTEEGTEVWTINYGAFPFRCDLCFNIHDLDNGHDDRFKAYKLMPDTKVVSVKSYDWLQNSFEYPMQEIMEDHLCGTPYLKNTTSYVLAFALACRVEEIEMYGCDFSYDKEFIGHEVDRYEAGRANVEFWLGMLVARGIAVKMAPTCSLMGASQVAREHKISFYGYGQYEPDWEIKDGTMTFKGFTKQVTMDEAQAAIERGDAEVIEEKDGAHT